MKAPRIQVEQADLSRPDHAAAVQQLVNALAVDPMGGGQAIAPDALARVVPGLQHHPAALVLLAFVKKEAVGVAVCFIGFSTFKGLPTVNIHDLIVLPEYRGQGIGRLLLKKVESHSRQFGACKLTLEVRADNTVARRVYDRFGFVEGGGLFDDTPLLFLGKDLTDAQ